MDQILTFLRTYKVYVLCALLIVTPVVGWAFSIVFYVLGLINWLGVLFVAAYFGVRYFKGRA